MRLVPLLIAAAATAATPLLAQSSCSTATGSARSLATMNPFTGNSLFGHPSYPQAAPATYAGFNFFMDVTSATPATINQIDTRLFDDGGTVGLGNGGTFLQPNQVGNTALVQVYICPTTWVGNEFISPTAPSSPWLLAGTGILTVAPNTAHTVIDFRASAVPGTTNPIPLSQGTTLGMAINVLPVAATGPNNVANTFTWADPLVTQWPLPWPLHPMLDPNTAVPPYTYTDGILTLAQVQFQRDAFTSGPSSVAHTQSLEVHYVPGSGSATWTQWGTGCERTNANWSEEFVGPVNTFDLGNKTVNVQYVAGAHLVQTNAGTANYMAPTSAPLTIATGNADDGITSAITLPFTFPYPGGSATDIKVGTNGYVLLNGTALNTFGWYGGYTTEFVAAAPRACPAWCDLDTTLSGTLHYDADPSGAWVRVTWLNIEEWHPTPPANMPRETFQLVMYPNGNMEYIYLTTITTQNPYTNSALVGFTPGGETATAGRDLSVGGFLSGDATRPPVLGLSTRPIVGTTFNFDTTNIKAGTFFNMLALGFVSVPGGTSLAPYGMPNCNLYLQIGTPITTNFGLVTGTSSSISLTIPNNPTFNGINMFGQSAPFTTGYNATGIFTSNAVCIALGLF